MPAKRGAEGARRAIPDAYSHLGEAELMVAKQILRDGHAPGSRYSIGGRPTLRVKRSKNAERESVAVCASWATGHERASWPCICRIAGAGCASANPRNSPGGA